MVDLKIFHLVCPNGLGHFKRAVDVWRQLQKKVDAEITIVCEKWQFESFNLARKGLLAYGDGKVNFKFVELQEGLRWQEEPRKYRFKKYLDERQYLQRQIDDYCPQLVISDNWVSAVGLHPNVLLMGSFLWHDILERSASGSEDLAAILDFERQLLANNRIPSISIKEMTMPGLQKQTENIGVPWLVTQPFDRSAASIPSQRKINILISTGLSSAHSRNLKTIIHQLNKEMDVDFYGGEAAKNKIGRLETNLEITPFDFSEQGFENIDLLIARPGMGAITESIQYQIPILAVDDGNNEEMKFNARQIAALRIGWDAINSQVEMDEIIRDYSSTVLSLKERPINGFQQIERIMQNQLSHA